MKSRAEVMARLRAGGSRNGESQARDIRFATVSGVLSTRPALIRWVDRAIPEVDLITTKSYQVRPNPGYREPVVVEAAVGCYGNAVGLRNPGMEVGFRELEELRRRHTLRALLCVSLSASSVEDFILLARRFGPAADLLELNLSCPHAQAGYGAAIGQDARTVAGFLRAIRLATARPLLAKLTPNVEAIGAIARAAVEAGADGISAINTVGPEVFRESASGLPILGNPNGGKGGKSGEWIKAVARAKVAEVRSAVGPGVPIIGMGGVSTAEDVLALRAAGADLVGLGSVLARVPRQELIPRFIAALGAECRDGGDAVSGSAASYLSSEPLMRYRNYRVAATREVSADLRLLTLGGSLPALPGQYAFLFIPGVGEKPFSVASEDPAAFVVRRRGPFTEALFRLTPGERLLVRGPYGAQAPPPGRSRVVVLAGGTGIAVAAPLARSLATEQVDLRVYFGARLPAETELADLLCPGLSPRAVADDGVPARVLELLCRELGHGGGSGHTFYTVGPEGFLERAAAAAEALGADPRRIFLCLETPSLCGVGLCGSCECGGRLLCKEGSFLSLEELRSSEAEPGRERDRRIPPPGSDRRRIAPPPGRAPHEPFVPAAASGPGF